MRTSLKPPAPTAVVILKFEGTYLFKKCTKNGAASAKGHEKFLKTLLMTRKTTEDGLGKSSGLSPLG